MKKRKNETSAEFRQRYMDGLFSNYKWMPTANIFVPAKPVIGVWDKLPAPMPEIKTIDVSAREWFDTTYGNSYFSATVTVNYGMPDEYKILLPFQYGYGEHYRDMCFAALKAVGLQTEETTLWRYCRENGVIDRYNKTECLKRELFKP